MEPSSIDVVRRAVLPELMLVEDVPIALRVTPATARRALLHGDCGPVLRIGRRLAVLREAFLAHLKGQEATTPELKADAGRG